MTDLWLSAKEIAAAGLHNLPTSKVSVIDKAKRENWPSRPRAGRGGGREYPVSALPQKAREQLLSRELSVGSAVPATVALAEVPAVAEERGTTGLADWQRRCMEARAAILMEVERLAQIGGQEKAIVHLLATADRGELRPDLQALIPIANAKSGKEGKRTISRRSLFRWKAETVKAGIAALAPREAVIQQEVPAWAPALMKLYRVPTQRPLAAIMEDLPAALPAGVPVPSYSAARRFLKSVSVVDRERGRHGPNGLLKFKAFRRRSTDDLMPFEIVSSDGHCFKADVAHPIHGRPFRPEVCAVIDLATRYVSGWSAGLAESAHVVMDAIRSSVEAHGQFGGFYTDNGSGYVGEMIAGEVTGLLTRIGATPVNSIAGRAQSRGKVERLQGTLWKRAARSLPTYSGRDMDNEARRRVVKIVEADIKRAGASPLMMQWDQFLHWAGEQVEAYNNRPHSALPKVRDPQTGKLRHQSPAEALEAARAQGWEPMLLGDKVVEDLFRPQLLRTAVRGEISLPWGRYFSHELEPFGGEKVRVGYDIHDGSRVWVRTLDNRLICIAHRDANVVPEMPASKVEHMRRERENRRIALKEQQIALIRAENGPALLEMSAEMPVEALRFQAELEAEFALSDRLPVTPEPAAVSETGIPLDPDQRFAFWHEVDAAIAAGQPVTGHLRGWHRDYQTLSEFRARNDLKELTAAFGSAFPIAAAG
ncbi:Mu transposase C-terminal domain-containing protein [Mesorhizobium sp. KR1-2]|uniref:Mu transposase C-terminal domain-containing protein n=1 Tax=Mesorhizobium sp. KR1-2 TaxID=3156609 RepID=UPI0032B4EA7A